VGPASAEELSLKYPLDTLQTMIELFDWHNLRGQTRDVGFLVHSIKNSISIQFPKGWLAIHVDASLTTADRPSSFATKKFGE